MIPLRTRAAPPILSLANLALLASAMPTMAETYQFVHTQSRQQIRVVCPSDPAARSPEWWKRNCYPVDASQADVWTGSSVHGHPDFMWVPTSGGPD